MPSSPYFSSAANGSRSMQPKDLPDNFLVKQADVVIAKIRDGELLVGGGGFCFGLLDPVSNILVNTLLSSTIAPPPSPSDYSNMAERSRQGLVAFLTRLFPYLPDHEAVAHLNAAGIDPVAAAHLVVRRRGMRDFDPCSATTAATSENALRLLMGGHCYGQLDPVSNIIVNTVWFEKRFPPPCRDDGYDIDLHMISTDALWPARGTIDVSKYNIHVICGVNELVSGPEYSTDPEIKGYNPWTPFKFHHSHINFLANCDESEGAGLQRTLFVAECSNHDTDTAWCIPVDPPRPQAEHVRCIYCESKGIRIVHPAMKGFHGRDIEFVKVLREEPLFHGSNNDDCYINDKIIKHKEEEVDWVHSVGADYIYCATADDADCDDDEDEMMYVDIC
uniref:Uncharacterized protein n=1 Tax=Oryza punctata TaxID=4537 RepID=A0A0E0L718_ORYPU